MQLIASGLWAVLLLEVIMNIKDEVRFQYLLTKRALKPFRVDIRALKEYNKEILMKKRKDDENEQKEI